MKLTELVLAELDREAVGSRKTLERVPAGKQLRYQAVRDGVLNHMAHHRGQLTVYLRLNGASVPAIYGPSADEGPS
jgi:uncharacterized damage-inducible protein DinB